MVRVTTNYRGNNKAASSGLKSRLGVAAVGDARFKIIAKNRSTMVDARDKLASLAKKVDARQKLQLIRNLKQGKVTKMAIPLIFIYMNFQLP